MNNAAKWLLVAIGLMVGSYVYQVFAGGDYAAATERAYFTGTTMIAAWIFLGRQRKGDRHE